MDRWVDELIYLTGEQVSTSEGNNPSHIYSINQTDSVPPRQLITPDIAGDLGRGNCRPPPTDPGPSLHPIIISTRPFGCYGLFVEEGVLRSVKARFVISALSSDCSGTPAQLTVNCFPDPGDFQKNNRTPCQPAMRWALQLLEARQYIH